MKLLFAPFIFLLLLSSTAFGEAADDNSSRSASESRQAEASNSLRMLRKAESQKSIISEFARMAASGDVDGLLRTFSDAPVKATGKKALEKFLTTEIIPFFADFAKVDTYTHMNGASFEDGTVGEIHYTYIVTKSGKMKPFVIALRDENGTTKVMNVTVNQCVKARHPVTSGRCSR